MAPMPTTQEQQRTTAEQESSTTPAAAPQAQTNAARAPVQLKGKSYDEQVNALRPDTHPGFDVQAAMLSPNASAVQLKGKGDPSKDIHEVAAQGTQGSGGSLPHLDAIQASFGSHDVSGVQAHTGSAAQAASKAIGAQAYASGNSIAFGQNPDLHTAAHEAAHVVQQRAGVSLSGGVGQAGDSYEQHADAVADAVVQGKSAEGLLDTTAGGGQSAGIQKKQSKQSKEAAGPLKLPGSAVKAFIPYGGKNADQLDLLIEIGADMNLAVHMGCCLHVRTEKGMTTVFGEIVKMYEGRPRAKLRLDYDHPFKRQDIEALYIQRKDETLPAAGEPAKKGEEDEKKEKRWSDPGLRKFEAMEAQYLAMREAAVGLEDYKQGPTLRWLQKFVALARKRKWPTPKNSHDAELLVEHLEWEKGWIQTQKTAWRREADMRRGKGNALKQQPKQFSMKMVRGLKQCDKLYERHLYKAYLIFTKYRNELEGDF